MEKNEYFPWISYSGINKTKSAAAVWTETAIDSEVKKKKLGNKSFFFDLQFFCNRYRFFVDQFWFFLIIINKCNELRINKDQLKHMRD